VFDARWRGSAMATFVLGTDGAIRAVLVGGAELRRQR
jgi:hypothetical protein